jgi:hypothetical protein
MATDMASTIDLSIVVKESGDTYAKAHMTDAGIMVPFDIEYKRDEYADYAAGQKLGFLAPTLATLLAKETLAFIAAITEELTPVSSIIQADGKEAWVETEEDGDGPAAKDVSRFVSVAMQCPPLVKGGGTNAMDLVKFGAGVTVKTTRTIEREKLVELAATFRSSLRDHVLQLLVLNDIIPAMPPAPRTEMSDESRLLVQQADQASNDVWDKRVKLDALRRAKEASAEAARLEAEIRSELEQKKDGD